CEPGPAMIEPSLAIGWKLTRALASGLLFSVTTPETGTNFGPPPQPSVSTRAKPSSKRARIGVSPHELSGHAVRVVPHRPTPAPDSVGAGPVGGCRSPRIAVVSEVRNDFVAGDGGQGHEDILVDGGRDAADRAVTEQEADAARVETAPAILAEVGVDLAGAEVIVGDHRGGERPGRPLGIQVEAVGPEGPARGVGLRVPLADEDGVGRAVRDAGHAFGNQAGKAVAVEHPPARG